MTTAVTQTGFFVSDQKKQGDRVSNLSNRPWKDLTTLEKIRENFVPVTVVAML